jgi:hypothetical protein
MGSQTFAAECGGILCILGALFLGAIFWTVVTRVANGFRIGALIFLGYQVVLLVFHMVIHARGADFYDALALAGLGSIVPHNCYGVSGIIHWLVQLPIAIKLLVLASFAAWIGTAGQIAAMKPDANSNSDLYEKRRMRLLMERKTKDFAPSRSDYGS